jgi:N utilization substance protein A
MTPEQLEEVPGIGEKTVEKISVAVRHYFGQYEEGEERPVPAVVAPSSSEEEEPTMGKVPEAILAEEAANGVAKEVRDLSAEDVAEAEETASDSDAYSDADAREELIERDNDSIDSLVEEAQEVSDEGIDDGNDRG